MQKLHGHAWLVLSALMIGAALGVRQITNTTSVDIVHTLINGYLLLAEVIVYIAALEVLKECLRTSPLLSRYGYYQALHTSMQTRLLALASAFAFGLGVTSFLGGLAKDKINAKEISEGMTTSMLMYPTTMASAYIYDVLGISSMPALILAGMPIALGVLSPCSYGAIYGTIRSPAFRLACIFGAIDFVYLALFDLVLPGHVTLKQSLFFIIIGACLNRQMVMRAPIICWKTRGLLVFMGSTGVLGFTILTSGCFDGLRGVLEGTSLYWAVAVTVLVIPLTSVLFIHPLVLFIVASPIITPVFEIKGVEPITQYLIWVTMIINAQLISPASLTSVLAASNAGGGLLSQGLPKHAQYIFRTTIMAFAYIAARIYMPQILSD